MAEWDNADYKDSYLYMKDISMTFGGTRALQNVELKIYPGEIHGLLGQNGCGKSTLIKILAGYHKPDHGGKLWINEQPVCLPLEPGDFSKYGMGFVHQDLGLIPTLQVVENLNLYCLAVSNSMKINWKFYIQEAKEIFEKYHININPTDAVATLGQVEKAILAIVRAVENMKNNISANGQKRGLLVLDEPTVFLPKTQVDMLFSLIRDVASEGISVLFVSHDLDEVMELTDSLTVLRDGRNVGTVKTSETQKEAVIEMILGKKLELYTAEDDDSVVQAGTSISVSGLSGELLNSVDFEAKEGEVLGLTGLVGSGFEEVPYLLFGAAGRNAGKLQMNNDEIDLENFSPSRAMEKGIALIPADRPNQGSIADLEIQENMMMLVLDQYNPRRLQMKNMYNRCESLLQRYEVNIKDPKMIFGNLSGGNQQKVLIAKWMQTHPKLLILHEPTQGVDIGARQQVYRYIDRAVKKGTTVICSSSDYEQLEQICSRVLIFVKGSIVKELVGNEISKEHITHYCYDSVGV